MKSSDSKAELHELLAELVESNLSEGQWRRLKQLIATDVEARRIYRRVLMAESLLERFQVDVNAPTVITPVDKGNRTASLRLGICCGEVMTGSFTQRRFLSRSQRLSSS